MTEAERLAATLESDANDHRAIAQSVDGRPEHTTNWQHMLTAEEAAAELRRLEAECEQLRADAARLDWLLWKLPGDAIRHCVGEISDTSDGAEFRAAIDGAMNRGEAK
jgi:hypothetical protein